ncbi:hypothetical protein D3C84_1085930 [compost metagenome]
MQAGPARGDLLGLARAVVRIAGVDHQADPMHAYLGKRAGHTGSSGPGLAEPAMMTGNLHRPWARLGSRTQGIEPVLQVLIRHWHAQLLDFQIQVQAGEGKSFELAQ